MNGRIFVLCFISFFLIFTGCKTEANAISGTAKVTIKVVDENNQPIEGANVGIGFNYDKSWATGSTPRDGLSGSDGLFSASDKTNGYLGFTVTKNNYYESTGYFNFEKLEAYLWKPWNPELTVVLRRIGTPVPMYARATGISGIEIPVANKEVGFDLVAFDWVVPYGKGIFSDFIFYLAMVDNGGDDFEYSLKIKFSNVFDGIKMFEEDQRSGSIFKLPRIAPIDGYCNGLEVEFKGLKRGSKFTWSNDHHYIFRIRSEKEDGILKRAMYGKILGDIKILSSRKKGGMPKIKFLYYLNPDYTRNLEFDPNKNLFGPLPPLEQVGIQ